MLFTWDDAELDDINKAVPVRSKNIDFTTPVQADESMVFFLASKANMVKEFNERNSRK